MTSSTFFFFFSVCYYNTTLPPFGKELEEGGKSIYCLPLFVP